MNCFLVTCAVVAAVSAGEASPDTAIELTAPQLAGGDRVVWAVRNRAAIDGAEPLEIHYCPRTSQPLPFRPLTGTTIRGKIRQLAARGSALHVFFDGGAHYRFEIPVAGQSSQTWSPESRLADGALPIALTGDADCLYAIVDARIAAKMESPDSAASGNEPPAADGDGDDEVDASEQPDPSQQDDAADNTSDAASKQRRESIDETGGLALVQYCHRVWTRVAALPIELDRNLPIRIAARDQKVWLLAATRSTREVVWTAWDGAEWSEPAGADIPLDRVIAMMVPDKSPTVIVAAAGDTPELTPWMLIGEKWQKQSPLSEDGAPLKFPAGEVSVSHFGSRVIASWRSADAGIQAALWKPSGGDALLDPHTVTILSIAPTSPENEQLQVMIGVIVLIALLSIIFARRRESFLVDLPLPPGYQLASFHRRLIAFTIDLLIVALVAYPIILFPWMDLHVDMTADLAEQIDQVRIAVMAEPDAVFWRWMAAATVFVVYGIITEALFAATFGKMIMGLRVSNDKGRRCSPQSILLRNVLRYIELYPAMQFAPTLIFVLMTRNRQRIGDLVARTVVVERGPTPQPATNLGDPNQGGKTNHDSDDASK